jgi:hypothetical protein
MPGFTPPGGRRFTVAVVAAPTRRPGCCATSSRATARQSAARATDAAQRLNGPTRSQRLNAHELVGLRPPRHLSGPLARVHMHVLARSLPRSELLRARDEGRRVAALLGLLAALSARR